LLQEEVVYKLKKPLDLGFLDFSTLERRRIACEDELRLNRRTAPDLYLEVVEVRGNEERVQIGGSDPILDYAVKMRRFAEPDRLDHMLEAGRLGVDRVDELAACIADFHGRIERADAPGTPAEATDPVISPMRANFDELQACPDSMGQRGAWERLAEWTERTFEALQGLIVERHAGGFVRECHGDLHLGNLALVGGRVTPFDCIEFSAELRWIDVMCDLAFLTMDLEDRGASGFAHRALDRYLELGGDYGGLPLLRFYQVYRAMVRAKIAAIRSRQEDSDREACRQDLEGYTALATQWLQPTHPRLILMHGVSASGKSWVSQALLEKIGAIRLRSDRERKRMFPGEEDLYEAPKTQATYERLLELVEGILRAGYPAIVDATFLKAGQRAPFAQLAEAMGVPFAIVHTQADSATLQERLAQRTDSPDNISDATLPVLLRQLETLKPPGPDEPVLVWDTTAPRPIEDLIELLNAMRST
jgi:hypothetical protein